LSRMVGLPATLRFQAGKILASALNAYELSAMIGMLGGVIMIGALPSSLAWNTALLLTCAPQLIGVLVIPKLVAALPAHDGPLFARQMTSGATAEPAAPPGVGPERAALGAPLL